MSWRRRLLVGGGVLGVLGLLLPLLWWQFLGPDRFRGLELGVDPGKGLTAGDFGDLEDRLLQRYEYLSADGPGYQEAVVELPPLTISPTTTVTVIFSVGSSGMTQADANRLRVGDISDRGADRLTDSIMLLVSDKPTRKAALLSLPRDLWLTHRGHRINETFARHGAQAFVDDVSRVAGLPVHHLVQANFTAFADLVDAIDGITLQVAQPMADLHSMLYVPTAGCWRFDGASALAYARSRHGLTTRDDGANWRPASGGNDFGRISRQQALVAAAWDQLRGPALVRRLPALIRLADGLTIDAGFGLDDVVDLARAFKDVAAGRVEGHTLPTVDRRVGAARVLAISYRRALPLYARLRSWPPADPAASAPSPANSPAATPTASASASSAEGQPSPTASPSPTVAPAPPNALVSRGCSRSNASELPPNPLDYLAAVANGDPTPPYDPTPSPPRQQPSDDESGTTSEQPSERPSGRPSPTPSRSQPEPEPSESDPLLCLPNCRSTPGRASDG